MALRHLLFGRPLMFPNRKGEEIILKEINKKALKAYNSFDLVDKFRTDLKSFDRVTLTNYLRILEADYEDWSTFNSSVVQLGQTIIMSFAVIMLGLFFKQLQDTAPKYSIAILCVGGIVMYMVGLIVMFLSAPLHQKLSFKKSKGKMLMELIKEILLSDYDKPSLVETVNAEIEVASSAELKPSK